MTNPVIEAMARECAHMSAPPGVFKEMNDSLQYWNRILDVKAKNRWRKRTENFLQALKDNVSDEMVSAAERFYEFPLGSSTPSNSPEPEVIFRAMISGAMKEETDD